MRKILRRGASRADAMTCCITNLGTGANDRLGFGFGLSLELLWAARKVGAKAASIDGTLWTRTAMAPGGAWDGACWEGRGNSGLRWGLEKLSVWGVKMETHWTPKKEKSRISRLYTWWMMIISVVLVLEEEFSWDGRLKTPLEQADAEGFYISWLMYTRLTGPVRFVAILLLFSTPNCH